MQRAYPPLAVHATAPLFGDAAAPFNTRRRATNAIDSYELERASIDFREEVKRDPMEDVFDEDDDENEDNLEHCIYRVKHTFLGAGGQRVEAESDFILADDKLLLVLQWMERPEGTKWPALTLELHEELLDEDPDRPGKYLYSGELLDPREKR